ncbi:MAG TPA: hypothetical protein VHB54_16080 [Mucilaginibacter sp.]|nr:hypothetical protein [Mucilaginibacter sp.]
MKTSTKTAEILKAIDNELKALLLKDIQEIKSRKTTCKTPLAA